MKLCSACTHHRPDCSCRGRHGGHEGGGKSGVNLDGTQRLWHGRWGPKILQKGGKGKLDLRRGKPDDAPAVQEVKLALLHVCSFLPT